MTFQMLNSFALAIALIACVIGFDSCAAIQREMRQQARLMGEAATANTALTLCRWGGHYFAGTAMLLLNCAMGDRAPIPVVASYAGSFGLGSAAFFWLTICAAGFASNKAIQYHRRQRQIRRRWSGAPFRALQGLVGAVLLLALSGCSQIQSLTQRHDPAFVGAMDATQRAVGPEYSAYVAADPALSLDQKARRVRTVQVWRSTIDTALNPGAANGPTTAPTPPGN